MRLVSTPRLRCVGRTATMVRPATSTAAPPRTVIASAYEPAVPPIVAPALAAGCSGQEYAIPRLDPGPILPPPPAASASAACADEGEDVAGPDGPDAGARACCAGLLPAIVYKGSILRLDDCIPEGDGHAI